jgi:hypothetical protein
LATIMRHQAADEACSQQFLRHPAEYPLSIRSIPEEGVATPPQTTLHHKAFAKRRRALRSSFSCDLLRVEVPNTHRSIHLLQGFCSQSVQLVGVLHEKEATDWNTYGKSAGHIRNADCAHSRP